MALTPRENADLTGVGAGTMMRPYWHPVGFSGKLYKDSVDAIAAGKDPIGTIRDESTNRIVEITPGEFKLN